MGSSIRVRLTIALISLAIGPVLLIGAVLAWQSFSTLQQQALNSQSEAAQRVSAQITSFVNELDTQARFIIETQGLLGLDQETQRDILSQLLAYNDAFDSVTLIDSDGQERVHLSRLDPVPLSSASYAQAEEFVIPKTTGEVYYSPVRFEATTGEPLMTIAHPVTNVRTGTVEAVLVSDVRIKKIWDLIAGLSVSQGQSIYVVDSQNRVVAHRNPSIVLSGTSFDVPSQNGASTGLAGSSVILAAQTIRFGNEEYDIVVEQEQADALAPAFRFIYTVASAIVVTLIVSSLLGLLIAGQIVRPVQTLATAARAISAGDLAVQAPVLTTDELGTLATTFNTMTAQLRQTVEGLEERVADRTRAVQLSADVSRRLSAILDQKQLITEIVEQIRGTFDYYHVHIYLYDPKQEYLVMSGGTGEAARTMLARGHRIEAGRGLVGRAATSRTPILVTDVTKDPGWLPNPLLPDTKAELAVPLAIGANVLGVLDVQHNLVNGLTHEDQQIVQSIGNQVAIALQNTRSYEQAQQQAERETAINTISQRLQSAVTLDDVLTIAARELGQTLGAQRVTATLAASQLAGDRAK